MDNSKLTWPPGDEQHSAQESVNVPMCERQDGEPGSPARDGDGECGEVDEGLGTGTGWVQDEERRVACP